MITSIETIQDPDNLVVTLAQAKKHLKVDADFTEEDDLIETYIGSAQANAEGYIGKAVGSQRLVIVIPGFESVIFAASLNDTVEKVEYYPDGDDSMETLSEESYSLRKHGLEAQELKFRDPLPALSVRDDAVKVTIKRGFSASDCPKPIKQAIHLMVGDSYERREDRGEIGYNSASASLMRQYRKWQ
ncbi:hypothetical protein ASG38_15010 [Flavobacterium sp. Leaf359]|uniref:head-tail connector protein n=1 Tax=Flavobacterium sp. Leaf359 TaxID=1736351 RepID=UPI0006FA22E6|nr:head-tail connector protein [Flavobacterium sp. Leaf359]KQS45917.1 hypothetical protein ASG38_15010 [Flavobacterium sp. Leaf359]